MKPIRTVKELRAHVDAWYEWAAAQTVGLLPYPLRDKREEIVMAALEGIVKFQGHAPTWAKELLRMYGKNV